MKTLKEFFRADAPASWELEANLEELTADELSARDLKEELGKKVGKQYHLMMEAALMAAGFCRNAKYGTLISPVGTTLDAEYSRIENLVMSTAEVDDEGNVVISCPLWAE